MKIVIDTFPLLSPLTGVGYYTYQIAKTLPLIAPDHSYFYFYGYYSQRLRLPEEGGKTAYHLKEALRKIPWIGAAARSAKGWSNFFQFRSFDIYFEPNFIPLNIPAQYTVVTIPDFSFSLYPQWHSRDKVTYFQKHFWEKIKKADRIIVISEFIRQEAIQSFGLPAEKLVTIHLGLDRETYKRYPREDLRAVQRRFRLPEHFILFTGSIEPRKNLNHLLRAYRELDESLRKEFKIVLAGFQGWKNEEIMEMLEKMESDVFYIGYVPLKDLAQIYNLADLFVYPSFYEGFGLPPLEAMACGCPVVVSRAASLPEVCGDAAFYINPHDVQSIADGLRRVLTDRFLQASLQQKGAERIQAFSWEKAARHHLEVFAESHRK